MTVDYRYIERFLPKNIKDVNVAFKPKQPLLCSYHFDSITGHQEFQQRLYCNKSRLVQGQLQAYFIWRQSAARGGSSCRNWRICPWHQLIWGQTEWRRRWKARIRCRLWPQDMKMRGDWYLTKNFFQLASCLGGWGHWLFTFLLWWFFFFFTDLRLNAVLVCRGKPFNRLQRRSLARLRIKFDQLHSFDTMPSRAVGERCKIQQYLMALGFHHIQWYYHLQVHVPENWHAKCINVYVFGHFLSGLFRTNVNSSW